MATQSQFRHEDVSAVPRGWRVRTITEPSGHRVRLAFPPGPRRKGAGKLISILHPKVGLSSNPLQESVRDSHGNRWFVSILGSESRGYTAEGYAVTGGKVKRVGRPVLAKGRTEAEAADDLVEKIEARYPNPRKKNGPLLNAILGGLAAGTGAVATQKFLRNKTPRNSPNERRDYWRVWIRRDVGFVGSGPLFTTRSAAKRWIVEHGESDKMDVRREPHFEGESEAKQARENPNGAEPAAALYESFHGRAPHEVLEMQESSVKAGDYAALGQMAGLWLHPVPHQKGGELSLSKLGLADVEFTKGDNVKLAATPNSTQLYLIGGNQELPLGFFKDLGEDISKEFIPIGTVYAISYITEKNFDGFRSSEYAHEFGEETGERPTAFYDRSKKRILLCGGAYSIAPIEDGLGSSPGIVN